MDEPVRPRSICVFAGSNHGADPAFEAAAAALGKALARAGIAMVYGGARIGLMGVAADACLAAGGRVTGIIPRALVDKEMAHPGLTALEIVENLHARKARMAELADGFATLPGGMGTLEELFEVWTWGQLGYHDKPVGLYNVNGYWDRLIAFLAHAADSRFIQPRHIDTLIIRPDADGLITAMAAWTPIHVEKWIGRGDV